MIQGKYARVHPATLAAAVALLGNYLWALNDKLWDTGSPERATLLEAEKKEVRQIMQRLRKAEEKSMTPEELAEARRLPSQEIQDADPGHQ